MQADDLDRRAFIRIVGKELVLGRHLMEAFGKILRRQWRAARLPSRVVCSCMVAARPPSGLQCAEAER